MDCEITMNKNQLISEKNRRMYLSPAKSETLLRPKNAVFISSGNSLRHELAKTIGAYMLRKWGDIKFDKYTLLQLKHIERTIELIMKDFPIQSEDFITEAVPKQDERRRIDLVRLSDEQWFEFECDPKISKKYAYTFYLP